MKLRWLILMSGASIWMLGSCSSPTMSGASHAERGSAPDSAATPNRRESPLPGRATAEEAFAVPKKDRPGLATAFGKSIKDPMPPTSFNRASAKPYGVDAIYYNDREGLKAMHAMNDRVDGYQTVAGGVLEWGIKGNFGLLPTYLKSAYYGNDYGSRRFVEGTHGGTYSIVLRNRCQCDLQAVLSVDGLDVVDGRPASVTKRGYVIPAGETLEVKGYRTGYNSVAAFQFSSVSGSYANLSQGNTRNVGVIGLAVYTPKGASPWTWMPDEVNRRNTANPFAPAP
ncbi:MAG TPA: hypothetical protein VIM57_04225 [Luteolibacter sp.]